MWTLGCVLLVVFCGTLQPATAGEDCKAYTDPTGLYQQRKLKCWGLEVCCGTCTHRTCCSNWSQRLTEEAQDNCFRFDPITSQPYSVNVLPILVVVVAIVFVVGVFVCCCVCPCCLLYKACRKPRPVVTTHTTTTVVQSQYPTQPMANQPYQSPPYAAGYHSIPPPVQPGYGNPAMPTAPYQGQAYLPTYPPPPYQDSAAVPPPAPVPYSHAGYSGGQMAYPLQPPTVPEHLSTQPAYNPAYVDPSKPTY